MTDPTNPATNGHGDYERRDIRVSGVLYFLLSLALFILICHFIVTAVFHFFTKRSEAEQTPVSPLVTNAPVDTRHLPTDYKDYLKQNFPSPQLEIDERTQLDTIRLDEEEKLNTYGYVDQQAGIVHIPIERAMDLIAQRGLPVRAQGAASPTAAMSQEKKLEPAKKKGNKK